MNDELHILILEDVPTDAELMEHALRKAGLAFQAQRVDTREGFERALDAFKPDAVLADYHLPHFTGGEALAIMRRAHPEVPLIIVSGSLGDEAAVELVHQGARDYVLKHNLARLDHAVRRALAAENGIRARKAAERQLHAAEEKYHAVFTEARDGIVLTDAESGLVVDCNPEFERQCGRPLAQIKTLHIWELRPPEMQEPARAKFKETKTTGRCNAILGFQRPDGTYLPVEVMATRLRIGDRDYIQSISRDITERKAHEAQISRLNNALRLLSACNAALIHARSEEDLFQNVCRLIVETGGYQLAWVSYPGAGTDVVPVPFARSGDETLYQLHAKLDHDPEHVQHCQTIAALRERKTKVCSDHHETPECAFDPLREAGVEAILALPLLHNNEAYGVLTIFSSNSDAFGAAEVGLVEELAGDLAYGITSLRILAQRKQAESRLAEQLDELRRWHDATLGREMRTLELKREVNELLVQAGQPPRYPSAEQGNAE